MDFEEIQKLVRLVNETGIAELEVQRGEERVRVRGAIGGTDQKLVYPTVVPMPVAAAAPVAATSPAPQQGPQSEAPAQPQAEEERTVKVTSPIVGTYYDAPSPGAAAFVKAGDVVHPKQVLCIIESMKLMNEIESEYSGTIVAKLVENGRPVEYGEALFIIRLS